MPAAGKGHEAAQDGGSEDAPALKRRPVLSPRPPPSFTRAAGWGVGYPQRAPRAGTGLSHPGNAAPALALRLTPSQTPSHRPPGPATGAVGGSRTAGARVGGASGPTGHSTPREGA